MDKTLKKEMLESYKWIKVKKYVDDDTLSWEERYKKLNQHHIEETNFLINFVRGLVREDDKKISIKVDTNDADYAYIKCDFDNKDIDSIKLMCDALNKFKPYKSKSRHGSDMDHRHNFPNGGRYGFDTHRPDLGGKSAYEYYVKSGLVSEDTYNTFKKYVKNRCFHTIKQIKIDKEVIFLAPRWGY